MQQTCVDLRRSTDPLRCLQRCDELQQQQLHLEALDLAHLLHCRAWALLHLGRFEEALQVVQSAAQTQRPQEQRVSFAFMEQLLQKCLGFGEEMAARRVAADAQPYGMEWYAQRVQEGMVPCTAREAYEQEGAVAVIKQTDDEAANFEYDDVNLSAGGMFHVFPCSQSTDAYVYRRHRTLLTRHHGFGEALEEALETGEAADIDEAWASTLESYHGGPQPMAFFPVMHDVAQKPNVFQPDPRCDVWVATNAVSAECHETLRTMLDARAEQTKDFPMPMYQNIIDPNLLVDAKGAESTWSASMVQVEQSSALDALVALQLCMREACGSRLPAAAARTILEFGAHKRPVAKVMSRLHDLDPSSDALLHLALEEVLNAAIPLVAELRRPALLLPGPLQVVTKAQRIFLQPGEEYEGVWHYDGKNEHIVAVAIYYYRYSEDLEGGDLEFLGKAPRDEWTEDDPFETEHVEDYFNKQPRVKVPVGEGTLVVFSNYQFIHRVLRMVHKGSVGMASRDFVLFFIVDQREPLPLTDAVAPAADKFGLRDQLLLGQLQPTGHFGVTAEYVCTTGNGSQAHLGWLQTQLKDQHGNGMDDDVLEYLHNETDFTATRLLTGFSTCPPTGRGLSWVFEAPPDELFNPQSKFIEVRVHTGEDLESSDFTVKYVNTDTTDDQNFFPYTGVRSILHVTASGANDLEALTAAAKPFPPSPMC